MLCNGKNSPSRFLVRDRLWYASKRQVSTFLMFKNGVANSSDKLSTAVGLQVNLSFRQFSGVKELGSWKNLVPRSTTFIGETESCSRGIRTPHTLWLQPHG